MAEVALERVGKTYANGVRAVQDVSLHVAGGELVVLVGPSGCGKTTTVRLIAGLETVTEGDIRIGGRVVTGEPPYRRDVALVFQRPALYPHLSVAGNLGFGLELRQRGSRLRRWLASLRAWLAGGSARVTPSVQERVGEVARLLRLSEVLDRSPAELSGGQQQRVALGRALVRRPAVLLLDEPLSNLDAGLRLEMRRELHLLHRGLRATMIYVTHDQEEALTLGDRVVVLDRGRVQQVDRPTALYERPANRFVAGFFGWPPINLLDGRLVAEGDGLRFVGDEGCLDVPACRRALWQPFVGRDLTLGIRPEHVRLGVGPPCWEVRLVEPFGGRRLLTVRRGHWTVIASPGERDVRPLGERVHVELDLPTAHLFDRASGQALSHGRP